MGYTFFASRSVPSARSSICCERKCQNATCNLSGHGHCRRASVRGNGRHRLPDHAVPRCRHDHFRQRSRKPRVQLADRHLRHRKRSEARCRRRDARGLRVDAACLHGHLCPSERAERLQPQGDRKGAPARHRLLLPSRRRRPLRLRPHRREARLRQAHRRQPQRRTAAPT